MKNQHSFVIRPYFLSREFYFFFQLRESIFYNSLPATAKSVEMIQNPKFEYENPVSSSQPYRVLSEKQKVAINDFHSRRKLDEQFNEQCIALGGIGLLIAQLGYLAFKHLEDNA